jgi:hydroxymethylpyrimidine kinase/phosphomethylpyrimidine kinase
VGQQLEALLSEQLPAAIKIGMLGSSAVVEEVADWLERLPGIPVILDPVWRASAGAALINPAGLRVLRRRLLPRAWVLKPNRAEAERLLGRRIRTARERIEAVRDLQGLGPKAVVLTGGDDPGDPSDLLLDDHGLRWYRSGRIVAGHARGTGCRFSAALAAGLARGWSVRRAVGAARTLVRRYLESLRR